MNNSVAFKSQSSSVPKQNSGNGTPYGGIQKGSYYPMSNSYCVFPTREVIDVNISPEGLIEAEYQIPCLNKSEAIDLGELDLSPDGSHFSYHGKSYGHESISRNESENKLEIYCQPEDSEYWGMEILVFQKKNETSSYRIEFSDSVGHPVNIYKSKVSVEYLPSDKTYRFSNKADLLIIFSESASEKRLGQFVSEPVESLLLKHPENYMSTTSGAPSTVQNYIDALASLTCKVQRGSL